MYNRLLFCSLLLVGIPASSLAYVGPGAGVSAIGSFLALIMVIFVAVLGFFWYPVKRLLKGKKKGVVTDEEVQQGAEEKESGEERMNNKNG